MFRSLPTPDGSADGETFRVEEFGRPEILLGKSTTGSASFLLNLSQADKDGTLVPLELPNLRVRHNCLVSLTSAEGDRSALLSVVECGTSDQDLQELFLTCMGHALPLQGPITGRDLAGVVDHLVELFRASVEPTRGEVLGLWGELLVAVSVAEPRRLLEAWHAQPEAVVDFADGSDRVDVKATLGPFRRHQFSFEQLNPPSGVRGAIVSLLTQQTPGATTVWELWQEAIRLAEGDNALRAKVDRICVKTLGRDWSRARHAAFDRSLALDTVGTFWCEAIPRICEAPPGVGRIRFEADLSRSVEVDPIHDEFDESSLIGQLLALGP